MNQSRPYIVRGGEAAWTGVSRFAKAKLYIFAVKADGALVDEMLTRYLGRPARELGLPIDVRGNIFGHVFFVFLDSERHQPRRKDVQASEGREREQLFALIVAGYRTHPDPGLFLFAPYVYSSDTPGWRAEREIFGYPQQRGNVEIRQSGGGNPVRLSLASPAIRRFAANATMKEKEIFHITRRPGGGPVPPIQKEPQGGIVQAIARTLKEMPSTGRDHGSGPTPRARLGMTAADLSFFERCSQEPVGPPRPTPETADLVRALQSGPLPMLFLKQFRDVVHAERACYQAIVEAPIDVGGTIRQTRLQDYVLTLNDIDSAPICRELGISHGAVPIDFAFRFDLDEMSLGTGKVISNPHWNPAGEPSIPDTPSRLPRYVDRGGEAVWRQPSLLGGARIYGFGVPVSELNQRALLKRCVNDVAHASNSMYGPRKFKLQPIAGLDMIMLLFVEYQRITSATDDDRQLGGGRYREFLAMQLALSEDKGSPELDWFIPFIYLDADSPRLAGREIFGYPKQLGTIAPFKRYHDGDTELDPARELDVSATVIHGYSETRAQHRPIVRIEGPARPPTIKKRYLAPQDMFEDLINELGHNSRTQGVQRHLSALAAASRESGTKIQEALFLSNVGNVFLKQFRDCAKPENACYQAVCKTDTVPGNFHGGGCLDPRGYRITIQNHASEPLLAYINGSKAPGGPASIAPVFAYWLDLDLELTNGRVLANPFEAPYVPDLSAGKTLRARGAQPHVIRRSRQREL